MSERMTLDSADPWLLHFTHIDNLPGIITGGLRPDSHKSPGVRECGQPRIKERRHARVVPVPPGGVVADYAPFYFAPRSPMLRSILGGQVGVYDSDQTHLVYLVTRLSQVTRQRLTWVASDRNAVLGTAKFTSDARTLADHIDWEIMRARYWGNTDSDGSRRERRMAELLVHGTVPWTTFSHVGVCCAERSGEAADLLTDSSSKIIVRPGWYFDVPGSCACHGIVTWGGGDLDDR